MFNLDNHDNQQPIKVDTTPKFYEQAWFIILSLLFFFPLGLFLVWRHNKIMLSLKIIITCPILIFTILFTLLVVSSLGKAIESSNNTVQVPENIKAVQNIKQAQSNETVSEENNYTDKMADILNRTSAYCDSIVQLNDSAVDNPSLMITSEFKIAISEEKGVIENLNIEVNSLTPPKKYTEIHSNLIIAFSYLVKSIESYQLGVNNFDATKIKESFEFSRKGLNEINKTNTMMVEMQK